MALPSRKHYPLEEVADAWDTDAKTLLSYAAEGVVEVSVPLFGVTVDVHQGDGVEERCGPALRRKILSGAHPLFPEDLWTLSCKSTVRVNRFRASEPDTWYQVPDGQSLYEVTLPALVITASERTRVETEYELVKEPVSATGFSHSTDYRDITIAGRQFRLSPKRADIVRVLHEAWKMGQPLMSAEEILTAAGSESTRIVDVFGPLDGWRTILIPDHRGNWRLNLPETAAAAAHRRVFRRPLLRIVR